MRPIVIKALKADRSLHQRIDGKLELANDVGCVVWTEPGSGIRGPNGLLWELDCLVRTLFVREARLNMLEIHEPDGTPRQVYLNVIAPMKLTTLEVCYVDHELDVLLTCSDGGGAEVIDEDDFDAAVETFGYDEGLVSDCWAAARLGLEIANGWEFGLSSSSALEAFALKAGSKQADNAR